MMGIQISVLDFLLDDHFALWDFADSFPDMRPDVANSQTLLLLDLVRRGLVDITFGKWTENETTRVPVDTACTALLDAANWNITGREPGYLVELAPAGRDFLRQKGIG